MSPEYRRRAPDIVISTSLSVVFRFAGVFGDVSDNANLLVVPFSFVDQDLELDDVRMLPDDDGVLVSRLLAGDGVGASRTDLTRPEDRESNKQTGFRNLYV